MNEIEEEFNELRERYEVVDLNSFMNLYAAVADRVEIKDVIAKYLEVTGTKLTQKKMTEELTNIGYQVKIINKNGVSAYATKKFSGEMYIVKLNEDKDNDIYKVGRTINMRTRESLYRRYNGGCEVHKHVQVNNTFACESALLMKMNEEFDKDAKGNEYFHGEYDDIERVNCRFGFVFWRLRYN